MDPSDVRLREAVRQQALPRDGDLLPAADAADVFRRGPQHLGQHLVVPLMPRRHNDDIVIPGDGPYPLQRLWEGPAEPRGRLREKRPGNKLLPLVIDRHPEIRYGEDMGQRLRHMSAAEEIHGPRLDQRLGEEGRLILRQQPPAAQQGLQPFHGNFRPPQAPGPVTGPHPPAAPVHGGDQP